MKVAQDRIPSGANVATPHPKSGHTRRRVKPIIAERPNIRPNINPSIPNINEEYDKNDLNVGAPYFGPDTQSSAAPNYQPSYQPSPYQPSPYQPSSTNDHQYYPEDAEAEPSSASIPAAENPQGPYRAVVVFLLLLMALVIMVIVYQLFFRPRLAPPTTAKVSEAAAAPTEEKPELQQTPPLSSPPETSTETTSAETKPSVSQSSPMSNVTPTGEEVEPKAPEPKGPSNDLSLLRSKVGGIGYWIQVGAFSSWNNANKMKQQLALNHLESVIQESNNGTKKVYRVRVGLYTSKKEAERILRQLKNMDSSFANSMIMQIEM